MDIAAPRCATPFQHRAARALEPHLEHAAQWRERLARDINHRAVYFGHVPDRARADPPNIREARGANRHAGGVGTQACHAMSLLDARSMSFAAAEASDLVDAPETS